MGYTPKISVVIISYNVVKFIGECIDSILEQTLQPYEIVIYDDCSTDGSWDVIQSYQKRYPNLIIAHRHANNLGMQVNINAALQAATGDLISWMDGNDRWLPQKLEREWAAICASPTAKVAYSSVYITNEFGNRTAIWHGGENTAPPTGDIFVETFSKRFFQNCRSLFRNFLMYRSALEELGYHDHNISIYIDWDLKIRIAAKYHFAYSGDALIEYRIHLGDIHNRSLRHHYDDLVKIYKKNFHLLAGRSSQEVAFVESELQGLAQEYGGGLLVRPELETARKFEPNQQENLLHDIRNNAVMENKGENLVFLIASPRSGSTLLQHVLANHSDIHTTEEPWLMLHPLYALKRHGIEAEYEAGFARQALDRFLATIPGGEDTYIESLRAMASLIYDKALQPSGKHLFLDKTPRYIYILPELFRVFPKAKYVVLLRNPAAVLSSVLRTWFNNDLQALKQNQHYVDLIKGPALLNQGLKLFGDKAITVHYEDLITNTSEMVKKICDYVGIPFQPSMLDYGGKTAKNTMFGDPLNVHRHRSVVNDYLETWREHLADPKLRQFAVNYIDTLGETTLDAIGYSTAAIKKMLCGEQTKDCRIRKDKYQPDNQSGRQNHNDQALCLNKEGETAFNNCNMDIAEMKFKQAQQLAPNSIDVLNNLMVLYWQKQDLISATRTLAEALNVNPYSRNIVINGGKILQALNKEEDAKILYLSYLEQYPNDAEITNLLYGIGKYKNTAGISTTNAASNKTASIE